MPFDQTPSRSCMFYQVTGHCNPSETPPVRLSASVDSTRQDQTVPSLGLINTSSDTCDTCDTCFMLIAPENTFNTNLQTCYGKALKNNNNNSNDYRENCVCGYEISCLSIDKRPAVFNKMAATDVRTTHGLLVIF